MDEDREDRHYREGGSQLVGCLIIACALVAGVVIGLLVSH
jgi:hypothetical protein